MEPQEQLLAIGDAPGTSVRYGVSIAASIAVSLLILLGITQARKTDVVIEEPGFVELRSVVLPSPPPPPPSVIKNTPLPPSLQNLEGSPTQDTMKVSVSPTPVTPAARPPEVELNFDFSPDAFKPSSGDFRKRSVYQRSEVDQPPIPVYKKVPGFNLRLMKDRRYAKISLLYIVNVKGTVEALSIMGSGGEAFDQVVMDGVRQWRFKPAIKSGKKVDCWVQQSVVVKADPTPSPFD